jgi:alkylation response protein AidB-like acyl-CoA dehydrogenase
MIEFLTEEQRGRYAEFCSFAERYVTPFASQWEAEEMIPRGIVNQLAAAGYLGCMMPDEFGGNGWDSLTYGIFIEALAKSSTSLSGLCNVHTMVLHTLLKWGTPQQKQTWLRPLAQGEAIGAFALTEPDAGSDMGGLRTECSYSDDGLVINGTKRWITFGGLADVFVVFGRLKDHDDAPVACLVEKGAPGLTIAPIPHMLGFKAGHLAELHFVNCRIPREQIIAKPGFAFSYVAPYALDFGRICVAFTALAILHGCLEQCCDHVINRRAFGVQLIDQSTIKAMITSMGVDYEAASHLCISACHHKDTHMPSSSEKIMIAKYFTSRAAHRHADNAVQILGARGCNEQSPVARYNRDSKILEIIEGSTQIHEMILGNSFARKYRQRQARPK